MSAEHDRERDLLHELEALLARAADGTPPAEPASPPLEHEPETPLAVTPWQAYALELRDLCRRVLEEADERTAQAFWRFLVETAARHGRRAGGSSS
jgi:hypothetical protein